MLVGAGTPELPPDDVFVVDGPLAVASPSVEPQATSAARPKASESWRRRGYDMAAGD